MIEMKKIFVAVCCIVSAAFADVTRDGVTVMSYDSGIVPPSGDFTVMITFRHQGYAPIPKTMSWRNGMIACCRSGYYDGWRVYLHDQDEARIVFEIGRKEGGISIESPVPTMRYHWHRLAVSWEGVGSSKRQGVMRLWLDGHLQAQSPANRPAPLLDGSTLKLGFVDFGVGALNLEVADVRCEARAFTNEEVMKDAASLPTRIGDVLIERPLLAQVYTRALARIALNESACRPFNEKPKKVIELKSGINFVTKTMLFEGAEYDNLLIRGHKDGTSVLSGGEFIPASSFSRPSNKQILSRFPVSVRSRIICAPAKGLKSIQSYGVGVTKTEGVMVFDAEGNILPHARWPNSGCVRSTFENGIFRFGEKTPHIAEGAKVLAYGYWRYLWADAALGAMATGDGGFKLCENHCYGFAKDAIAALFGVPEVADSLGEWCIVDDVIYIVKPDVFKGVWVPRFGGTIIKLNSVRNACIENVTISDTIATALEANSCPGLRLERVKINRAGGNGAVVRNCQGVLLSSCSFSDIGHTALNLIGGERKTLTSGEMVVMNCAFMRQGRLKRTYTPSILLEGCGGSVIGSTFSDMPSSAMRIEGNDHLVRDCVFTRTVLESDDQGAIDIWGDMTYRGNVFFRNTFRDVGGDDNNGCGRAAIRFDDMISGMAVISNTFINCAQGNFGAVQMNGGHYNAIVGNDFIDCSKGVTGGRWGKKKWSEVLSSYETKMKRSIAEKNAIYLARYPELDRIGTEEGVQLLMGNTYKNVGQLFKGLSMDAYIDD